MFKSWRRNVLRLFGARMGRGSVVRASAVVVAPWNLTMGEGACVAEHTCINNVAPVVLGSGASVASHTILDTEGNDTGLLDCPPIALAITIGPRARIAAHAYVGPGVCIGPDAVVEAGATVASDVEAFAVVAGNPAQVVERRCESQEDAATAGWPRTPKVGIVTIVRCNNYGAELQAFALQRKMALMGLRAEIIDYLFYKHPEARHTVASRPFYHFPLTWRVKELLLPLVERLRTLPYAGAAKRRRHNFDDFHRRNTVFSKTRFRCCEELEEAFGGQASCGAQYDVYCVGSDQVWSPHCYTNLSPYFLAFAPPGRRRFSYASSFGVVDVPEEAKPRYAEGLRGLDVIGVREATGADIVRRLTQRQATVVADPTLLLTAEQWRKVAKYHKVPQRPYLLLYVLAESGYITRVARQVAQERGLGIVRICKCAARQDWGASGIDDILDAGPDDFVGLFDRAQVVLTNSFHGTAFSLIFGKDFRACLRPQGAKNSRITDLLRRLELMERIQYEDEPLSAVAPLNTAELEERLRGLRTEAESFINRAIYGE